MKKIIFFIVLCLMTLFFKNTGGQILDKLGKRVEQKVKQRAGQKVDKAIDKGLDKTEETVKNKSKEPHNKSSADTQDQVESDKAASHFKVNTKFDFVAGDKVIEIDNFSKVNLGDFPSQWNTNGSGEVVTIDGQDGKWLEMKGNFTYFPEFIKSLPDNFTIEFDLVFNYAEKYLERNILGFYFIVADKVTREDPVFKFGFNKPGKGGAGIEFHSYQPNTLEIFNWENKQMNDNSETKAGASFLKSMPNHVFRISIWRQQDRLRMYLDDNKIVDAPRLLQPVNKINMFKIGFEDWGHAGRAYISNFRFAESTADMRNKLITEGKFVTSGIYYSTGSDKIKPESYGVLRQIAEILKEDPSVTINLVGHTDSDGSAGTNLELSKKRAAAVKNVLEKEYGISAGRMQTDGKGQSQPVSSNNTEAGKANNRRVEFIKM
ncbi:MAG: hypothetical protein ABS68_05075 [Niastella sp. SCN 39-18]|nr:OmpA family protein [Sphingobacteriales bacterium]ODT53701.1 MAG: hypothetical protein ABS68_05075 [Niastella sp. SCN 39-18]OJW09287.1 MAG: hypothetical protein BGO53_02390 [Sphingobacteriales bacterium 39-19]